MSSSYDGKTIVGGRMYAQRSVSHLAILAVLAILVVLLVLVVWILGDARSDANVDAGVMATFGLNAVLGIALLVHSIVARPFSLVQIHWLFYIIMFVIAPVSQYLYGYNMRGHVLTASDYLVTNVLLFVWGALFAIGTNLVARGDRKKQPRQSTLFDSVPLVSDSAAIAIFAMAVIAAGIVVYWVGFENLFSRGTYSTGLDRTAGLLFDKVLRPIPVFSLALLYIHYRQSRNGLFLVVLAGILVLVADFPSSMARYGAGCLYGGLALIAFDSVRTKHGLFPVLLLVAFLVVFPAGNVYRFTAFDPLAFFGSIVDSSANLSRGFCAVDYDAYSMIPRVLHYIESYGTTSGFQLLTVLLFFVPKAMWPLKSSGSGSIVAQSQGQEQINVCCPLPGEGIMNFGIAGLVVFAVVAALICKKVDEAYQTEGTSGLYVFYPFACLMFFLIMRGDLLSSFAFLCGYLVSFLIVWSLVRLFPAGSDHSGRTG